MIAIPYLADRFGSVRSIVATQAVAVVVLLAIPNSPLLWLAAVMFALRMILMNIAGPIATSFMMNLVPERDRSSATSVRDTAWWSTWTVGNFMGGLIMETDLETVYYVTAACYVAYLAVFAMFFWKRDDLRKKVVPRGAFHGRRML
jgi:MFS family permease